MEVRDVRAGKARRLGVRVVAARGGRLYLKGTLAVITALEVVADGERFWFQVPSRKTIWTGRADANPEAEDEHAPYYALRPADVTSALLPEPLSPGEGEALLLEGDREAFVLTLASRPRGVVSRKVWLDRESLHLVRSRRFDGRGDVVLELGFGDWRGELARRVAVVRPSEGYQAHFSFDKVQANVTVPPRVFVPRQAEGYRVVEVGP